MCSTAGRARDLSFTAIDFETANERRDSACAVGVVRVEAGAIVRRYSRLLRPPTRRFEFSWLHGIRWEDVAAAPTFASIWPELRDLCAGVDFVAAHNASFDAGVLDACCDRARVTRLRTRYECTVALARKTWGIYPTRLDIVAARLGVPLRHHDAASDAEACARIVLLAHGVD
jgi:DNA polymerase III subunit epsilon